MEIENSKKKESSVTYAMSQGTLNIRASWRLWDSLGHSFLNAGIANCEASSVGKFYISGVLSSKGNLTQ